jgi:hypothetical protein
LDLFRDRHLGKVGVSHEYFLKEGRRGLQNWWEVGRLVGPE